MLSKEDRPSWFGVMRLGNIALRLTNYPRVWEGGGYKAKLLKVKSKKL